MIIHDITRLIVLLTSKKPTDMLSGHVCRFFVGAPGRRVFQRMKEAALKSKNRKRKHRALLLILIQLLLLCPGCGRQESVQDAQSEENTVAQLVAKAPLLEWENPETENLAGMLQETCGGVMVRLTAGKYVGSGIIYSEEENFLVIVTAAHVLADAADGVQIVFVDGWETKAEEFSVSELADLAVVRVPMAEIPRERLEEYLRANVDKSDYERLQAGDGCIVMGSRSGVAEDAYEGIVLEPWIYMEDYEQYMIWASAPGKPGMSGGGLFDRRGRLLGILSGRSEDGEWAVVPLAMLLAELPGAAE